MKMEMPVLAPSSGIIRRLLCEAGKLVVTGQRLAIIDADSQTA